MARRRYSWLPLDLFGRAIARQPARANYLPVRTLLFYAVSASPGRNSSGFNTTNSADAADYYRKKNKERRKEGNR
jgi:hypothetical protein